MLCVQREKTKAFEGTYNHKFFPDLLAMEFDLPHPNSGDINKLPQRLRLQTSLPLHQDDCRGYRPTDWVAPTNRSIRVTFDFQTRICVWFEGQIFFLTRLKTFQVILSGGFNELLTEKFRGYKSFLVKPKRNLIQVDAVIMRKYLKKENNFISDLTLDRHGILYSLSPTKFLTVFFTPRIVSIKQP
jgi:hypothetical protein